MYLLQAYEDAQINHITEFDVLHKDNPHMYVQMVDVEF